MATVDIFNRPPCPGDPTKYIWVQTREGGHWQQKRGTVKPAKLNEQFAASAAQIKITAPAASRMVRMLRRNLAGLDTGRITSRLSGRLRKALNESGTLHYAYLKDFDLQPRHQLQSLLDAPYKAVVQDNELVVTIPIDKYTVNQHSKLVTNYYFELVMLSGNPSNDYGVRVVEEASEVFPIKSARKEGCTLRLPIPDEQWVAFLKVSCIEENEMAAAPRNYGMKVVGVGSGKKSEE
jgi:hypothetical protein